jgi:hypothetical protein
MSDFAEQTRRAVPDEVGLALAAKPDFSPIGELFSRTTTERYVRAAAHGPFEVDGIAKLSHLSRSIDNDFVEPASDAGLAAAQLAHVRKKLQPAVECFFIQAVADIVYGSHLD